MNRNYNTFQMLTKLEYQAGLIKEESISELLGLTIRHILNQARNQPEYQNTRTIRSSKPAAAVVKHRIK
jgi:hypothetical protein